MDCCAYRCKSWRKVCKGRSSSMWKSVDLCQRWFRDHAVGNRLAFTHSLLFPKTLAALSKLRTTDTTLIASMPIAYASFFHHQCYHLRRCSRFSLFIKLTIQFAREYGWMVPPIMISIEPFGAFRRFVLYRMLQSAHMWLAMNHSGSSSLTLTITLCSSSTNPICWYYVGTFSIDNLSPLMIFRF